MYKIIVVVLFVVIGLLQSCNTTEPPPPDEKLTLTLILEDVSSIEAWIKLTTNNLQLPATVTLKRNNSVTQDIILSYADTVIYIDSLLPNTTYSFHAAIQPSNQAEVKSNELNVTTMDTTSHDFTWQTFTFGEHSSSVLYDVAIINPDNIWAVGEIYLNDSLGNPDPHAYNAVHWDGVEWKLFRIMFYTICGQQSRTSYPASAIFAFNANEVWIGMDGRQIAKIDGTTQVKTICPPFSMVINKIWGTSSEDLYIVGNSGNIAWYNGARWTRIESGTETNINDIWGIITNQNKTVLYCPVSSFFVPGDKKILKIIDRKVDSVSWNRDVRLYSAWAMNENFLFVCGEGAFEYKFGHWTEINLQPVGTNSIRGNDINDVFIVGDFGSIFHFNGIRWQMLGTFNSKGYSRVAIKNDIVAICGNFLGQGLIEVGTRN